ncbi:hypothetical protein LshimejAT787_1302280 [Lyophyllum shimeji]|uniref:Uncharacterized protein n=1 Tax=Lyophyllum shimeji TaxID=47721 RepID=A0A9P3PUT9_LYOSH|nr:hypothetical protein LshimejAT787_1302280 [Lyophyllum shimeji]
MTSSQRRGKLGLLEVLMRHQPRPGSIFCCAVTVDAMISPYDLFSSVPGPGRSGQFVGWAHLIKDPVC